MAAEWLELLRVLDEREVRADEREWLADERERIADDRERMADAREQIADERERAADKLEAQRYDDRALGSSGAPDDSTEAFRHADEAPEGRAGETESSGCRVASPGHGA